MALERSFVALILVVATIVASVVILLSQFPLYNSIHQIPFPRGPRLRVDVNWESSTRQLKATISNRWDSTITLSEIYVNGKLDAKFATRPLVLQPEQTVEITLSESYTVMPSSAKLEFQIAEGGYMSTTTRLLGFRLLRVYWNEDTGQVRVIVGDTEGNDELNLSEVYVNGVLDDSAVVTWVPAPGEWGHYGISLSGKYASRPTQMLLEFTAEGNSFEFSSPFTIDVDFRRLSWDPIDGKVKFEMRIPSAFYIEQEKEINFEVYLNGKRDAGAIVTRRATSSMFDVVLSKTYATCPSQAHVRVVTDFGAYAEETDNDLTDNVALKDLTLIDILFGENQITIMAKNTRTQPVTVNKVIINDAEYICPPVTIESGEQGSVNVNYSWAPYYMYSVTLVSPEGARSYPRIGPRAPGPLYP